MLKLKARDIVNMETVELWSIPDGPLEVEFDDGVLETNGKATKLSWYFWQEDMFFSWMRYSR
jgi:hypothetical protein